MPWNLQANPFGLLAVRSPADYVQALLVRTTELQRVLRVFQWGYVPMDPMRVLLIGDRGSGKSTGMMALYDTLRHCGDTKVEVGVYTRYIELPRDIQDVIPLVTTAPPDPAEPWLVGRDRAYYVLVDVPDEYNRDRMLRMLRGIDALMCYRNIHVFVAMSLQGYERAEGLTELLGKFDKRFLPPLTVDETVEMVRARLHYYRLTPQAREDLYPLHHDTIRLAHDRARGNPRVTMSFLRVLLDDMAELGDGLSPITPEDLQRTWKVETHYQRVIDERVEDTGEREALRALYRAIRETFSGTVPAQDDLVKHMAGLAQWGANTTIRRVNRLVKIGLLDCQRIGGWTKSYRVV